MKFVFLFITLVAGLLISDSPAAAERNTGMRQATDQIGRTVMVPVRPERVISLMPSLTEIVFDLGQGDKLVGATRYAKEPPAAAKIPRVGSYQHLDVERIVALHPDLCLAVRDGNPQHLVARIEQMNIPVYVFDPRTLPEIIESVQLLGNLLQAKERAEEIARQMERKIAGVEDRLGSVTDRPGVFFQIDAAPMVSAGSGTFIDRLITMAGGKNLAAGPVSYPRYSWEDILAMQPEVVIIASMAGGYTEEQLKKEWRQWPHIPAVRQNRVYVVDASLFDRPVPRLADGLVALARLFHPE
ncbi:MAG: cobalamin-binding protein [Desulfobulbaceae bacterium]|nr:cobalamin-binding protein [Desulfobulbaceae bacterium]